MKTVPRVTVLMSVYNGEEFVAEAVDSILAQTYENFELIIINDGSTDRTTEILGKYADKRIKVIMQRNQGLVASLNTGISLAKGKYVARQDADDRSEPERLEAQVKYLEARPRVIIVGSSVKVMNQAGQIQHEHRVLLRDPELRHELLVRSPFAHGSVMFVKNAAVRAELYDQAYWPAEDYEFWLRISRFGELANIDEPLYVYREHDAGISATRQADQQTATKRTQTQAWQKAGSLLGSRIRLAPYKKLPHGELRIRRIISNVAFTYRRAMSSNQPLLAGKILWLLAANPIAYKKVLGKAKRSVLRK